MLAISTVRHADAAKNGGGRTCWQSSADNGPDGAEKGHEGSSWLPLTGCCDARPYATNNGLRSSTPTTCLKQPTAGQLPASFAMSPATSKPSFSTAPSPSKGPRQESRACEWC